MPSLEAALSEAMQGSLSNELDEQTFNGASGELNGLFVQATDVAAASGVETYTTGIARFAALVDGRHAYTLSDLRRRHRLRDVRALRRHIRQRQQGRRVAVRLPHSGAWFDSCE